MEDVSIQQLRVKCDKFYIIASCRDKCMLKMNLQENRPIFDQIKHIQPIGKKLVCLPKKHQHHITLVDLLKFPLDNNGMNQYFKSMRRWQDLLTSVP